MIIEKERRTMALNQVAENTMYEVTGSDDVERRIVADLSRIGKVEEMTGDIMTVDGQWHLVDVVVKVESKVESMDVHCVRAGDTIVYKHNGKDLNPADFNSPYEPDDPSWAMVDTLSRILQGDDLARVARRQKKLNSVSEFFRFAVLVVGLSAMFLVPYLTSGFLNDVEMFGLSLIPVSAVLMLSVFFGVMSDKNSVNQWLKSQVEEHRTELNRAAVRIAVKKNCSYAGNLSLFVNDEFTIMKNPDPKKVKAKFMVRNADGVDGWCTTKGHDSVFRAL